MQDTYLLATSVPETGCSEMPAPDSLIRFLFENAAIRGEIVHLDESWREVLRRVEYPPVLRDALGELTAAAALLIATLKFDGSLVLQMQSEGAVRLLVVEIQSSMRLRAMAKWEGEPDDAMMRRSLREGRLVLTLDPGEEGQQAWQGIVALEGGSVAEALMNYMTRSEQIDTRIVLAADAQQAAGVLIQRLPDLPQGDADAWDRASRLLDTLTREELLYLGASEVLRRLFHEEDLRVFEPQELTFFCGCSRQRVADMLRLLGQQEVNSVLEEQGQVDVQCEFCGHSYHFDSIDAAQLWLDAGVMTGGEGSTRH